MELTKVAGTSDSYTKIVGLNERLKKKKGVLKARSLKCANSDGGEGEKAGSAVAHVCMPNLDVCLSRLFGHGVGLNKKNRRAREGRGQWHVF